MSESNCLLMAVIWAILKELEVWRLILVSSGQMSTTPNHHMALINIGTYRLPYWITLVIHLGPVFHFQQLPVPDASEEDIRNPTKGNYKITCLQGMSLSKFCYLEISLSPWSTSHLLAHLVERPRTQWGRRWNLILIPGDGVSRMALRHIGRALWGSLNYLCCAQCVG